MDSRHEKALELLAAGQSATHAAGVVGVDARTVRRWKKEPYFSEELNDIQQEVHDFIMRRSLAIVEQMQTAALANLNWLETSSHNAATLTEKLRCIGVINQLTFKWTQFITNRHDRKTIADLARLTQSQKAAQKADTNGHASAGAPDALPAAPTIHPCPDDLHAQKADENGQRPETPPSSTASPDPELQELAAHRAQLASKSAPKADKNGHATTKSKWAGKGSHHVPFYKNIGGRR